MASGVRRSEVIEEGYEKKVVGKKEAERRARATENKVSGGGNSIDAEPQPCRPNKKPLHRLM